jgi:hypothetical protein
MGHQWWWRPTCLIGHHLFWCPSVYKPSGLSPSSSSLSHSHFFLNTKLYHQRRHLPWSHIPTLLGPTYLCISIQQGILLRFYIDLQLVPMITGRVYSNIFFSWTCNRNYNGVVHCVSWSKDWSIWIIGSLQWVCYRFQLCHLLELLDKDAGWGSL